MPPDELSRGGPRDGCTPTGRSPFAAAFGMPRAVGGVHGAPERAEPRRAPARSPVSTCIGAPDGMSRIKTAHALSALVNEAYGFRRVSEWDMQHRLRAGSRRLPPAPLTVSIFKIIVNSQTRRPSHLPTYLRTRAQPGAPRGYELRRAGGGLLLLDALRAVVRAGLRALGAAGRPCEPPGRRRGDGTGGGSGAAAGDRGSAYA